MPLFEILVAFVIAALSLGVLIRASGDGLHATRVAVQYDEALSRARSRLAAAADAPRAGEQAGDDGGGFAWRVLTVPADASDRNPMLYRIRVTVSWSAEGSRREVTLTTERLGYTGASGP